MGTPLMIQPQDAARITRLQTRLSIKTKVDVVRTALSLLEKDAERIERAAQWKRAAALVAGESKRVNRQMQKHSPLKRT